MAIRGSSQQGCCDLGPMDGSTPTPESHARCLIRIPSGTASPNSTCQSGLIRARFKGLKREVRFIQCHGAVDTGQHAAFVTGRAWQNPVEVELRGG